MQLPDYVYCPCGRFGIPKDGAHSPLWHDGCGPTPPPEAMRQTDDGGAT